MCMASITDFFAHVENDEVELKNYSDNKNKNKNDEQT